MSKSKTIFGTVCGMGLSKTSELHLFDHGFYRDTNYFVRLSGHDMIVYRGSVKKPKREKIHENSIANLKQGYQSPGMSHAVRKKIVKLCDAWVSTVDFAESSGLAKKYGIKNYMALITLTLPVKQMHDDRHIKRYALMMFIKELKKCNPRLNYVWKAETQKNGNIHFHIIIDHFIDKNLIDVKWYMVMSGLGYTKAYTKKTGKEYPPMTNVEALRNKNSAVAYVSKYITKDSNVRDIEGRQWGCSRAITNLKVPEMSVNEDELKEVFRRVDTSRSVHVITDYAVVVQGVNRLDCFYDLAMQNAAFQSTLVHNMHILNEIQYMAFGNEPETVWEQEVIDECNQINALYLWENDMIGY